MTATSEHRAFKDRLYAEFATLGRALASGHRLELLDLLAQGERSVEDLAREAGLTLANASAHLQVLRRARLIEAEKRGQRAVYRLAHPAVFELWRTLRDLGQARLAEVDRLVDAYLHDRRALEPIDKAELLRLLAEEAVTVVDVRPVVEYGQGHILRARSIPLEELERRIMELPTDREVVAYCRGPYCVFADHALRVLQRHGFRARRLREGFPEWRAAGYPTGTGAPAARAAARNESATPTANARPRGGQHGHPPVRRRGPGGLRPPGRFRARRGRGPHRPPARRRPLP